MRSGHPYRTPPVGAPFVERSQGRLDRASLLVLSFIWIATAIRVGLAFATHEPTAAEPILALTVLIALPWLARGSVAELYRRVTKSRFERPVSS